MPKLSDFKAMIVNTGRRPPATARHKRAGKARPNRRLANPYGRGGVYPARKRPIAARDRLQESLNLGNDK
jgi:hypothetical protein